MEVTRKEAETRSAVYSAFEGKGESGDSDQRYGVQTGMTMVAFAKWLDDHHFEYDIEMRTFGRSLESRFLSNKPTPFTPDAVVFD